MERAPPAATLPLFLAAVHLAHGGEEGSVSAVQLYIVAAVLLCIEASHGRKVTWLLSSPVVLLSLIGLGFQVVAPVIMARKGAARKKGADNKHVEAHARNEFV